MRTRIERKSAFKITGISAPLETDTNFKQLTKELNEKVSPCVISKLGNGQQYVTNYISRNGKEALTMVGYDVKNEEIANRLGLEVLEVPQAEYIVISMQSDSPYQIMQGWEYVNNEFFGENKYIHAGTPDFKMFDTIEGQEFKQEVELCIPIIKLI